MKKLLTITFIFSLVLCTTSFPQVICLSGKSFKVNELSLRASIEASVSVTFDVKDFKPRNVRIKMLTLEVKSLEKEYINDTQYNLSQFTFLKDTLNFNLKINYTILSSRVISNSYAELVKEDEVNLVFKNHGIEKYNEAHIAIVDSDTMTFENYIPYDSGRSDKADILVERVFSPSGDSTIIIRNNFPELTEKILAMSKEYSKEDFILHRPSSKWYFIRFYHIRRITECDYHEEF